MTRSTLLGSALLAFSVLASAAPLPQSVTPAFAASIHDEPVDGIGDSFNATPFEGLIRTQSTRADRAIQEYDVSAFAGQSIASATLVGRVAVNNAFDNGVRTFDFKLYAGNGVADLGDYQISATLVGTGQYHPPIDVDFTYQFDVTGTVQSLLTGGANFVGLRVEGSSNPNFPNILVGTDCHLDLVLGTPAILSFCTPGSAGVAACPCSNPPAGADRGCDNSAATGGASLGATGTASLANDSLVFTTAGQRPNGTSIVLQGTSSVAAGAVFGQGIRCVGGVLKRLYQKSAVSGSISAPAAGDASVSARSAQLGDPLVAGQHRFYSVYYRDPIVLGGCAATATFNTTDALDVAWN
ncbi:MAG: hypothetical protein IPJ19_20235 [Planctomycetes bacterium]|nr:hypothetical protein [Planctomycetota bacterium]